MVGHCQDCIFWDNHGDCGECHRWPPVKTVKDVIGKNAEPTEAENGSWMFTDNLDWCGEWQPVPAGGHPIELAMIARNAAADAARGY